MKLTKNIPIFVSSACILWLSNIAFVNAQEPAHALTIHTEHFPPYNYARQENITGINVEIVKALCEHAGVDCNFALFPWNRAMRMTKNTASTGLVSTARKEEREDEFLWVGPLVSGINCVYKLTSRDDISINTNTDLSNYILGTSSDASYIDLLSQLGFDENKNLILYRGKYGALKPFVVGRIDLIIGSATSIASQLEHVDLSVGFVQPVARISSENLSGNYLALNKTTPSAVVDKLKAAYVYLNESGSIDKIRDSFKKDSDLTRPTSVDQELWNICMSEYE
ncbi:substrate-binding periplasmic protein [Glaciecola petra]|uniref:Transporter substrate-binding domain-containing protein n=1 Tax=Glaciecola petra TaxID=3075602 RepID=A0ABU2ZUP6_9ALTE|nr:transporter substrate-binding domain-containing protein [Aestuariibacter sp. P117]MDT0595309.1 transporter substrate-binding domain-containing protein [Aestuariibacter sp. P117]